MGNTQILQDCTSKVYYTENAFTWDKRQILNHL